jgi:aconitate hydratase
VYLRDIWPTTEEINELMAKSVRAEFFEKQYGKVFEGDALWQSMKTPEGETFAWDPQSTYVRKPPYFDVLVDPATSVRDLEGLRVLAMLGDSITTDHISPAGSIAKTVPAANYLMDNGVKPVDFNSYGSRRGNDEVMTRGTLANIRLRNELAPGTEGGWTAMEAGGTPLPIYDASVEFRKTGTPLMIIAGKEYGSGSSRDWAAKGVALLGVKAVIAESYERIHRSNLVGMGVLPLEFLDGATRQSLGLTGFETFEITGVPAAIETGSKQVKVQATVRRRDGEDVRSEGADRHAARGGVLPQRRDSALRAAAVGAVGGYSVGRSRAGANAQKSCWTRAVRESMTSLTRSRRRSGR